MPTELEKILYRIEADTSKLAKSLKTAERKTQQSSDKMTVALGRVGKAVGALGVGAAFISFSKSVIDAQLASDRITNALRVATGSADGAKREFQFLREESSRLGINLESAGREFSKFAAAARGTSLEGEKARQIFSAIAGASTVLGLSTEQMGGALNAIQQMISKGTVAAEELRGQLGERLPGAFQLAAKAMGKTTQELGKMLEQGQIAADDLLPKLATELEITFGPEIEEASRKLGPNIERMNNALFEMATAIAASGLIDMLIEAIQLTTELAEKFGNLVKDLRGGDFSTLAGHIEIAKAEQEKFNKAIDEAKEKFREFGVINKERFAFLIKERDLRTKEIEQLQAVLKLRDKLAKEGKKAMANTVLPIGTNTGGKSKPNSEFLKFGFGGPGNDANAIARRQMELSGDLDPQFATKNMVEVERFIKKKEELLNLEVQFGGVTDANNANVLYFLDVQRSQTKALEDFIETQTAVNSIIERGKTPFDKYNEQMVFLEEAVRKVDHSTGKTIITTEDYQKAVAVVTKEWENSTAAAEKGVSDIRVFGSAIGTAMEDAIFQGKGLREVMGGLLQDIGKIIFRLTVTKTLEKTLGGFSFGGLFGSKDGNVFSGGNPIAFAKGGIVGGPTSFPMGGSRVGLMGEAGPEAIMPLKRGRGGKLGVSMNGGGSGGQTVYYIDARGSNSDEGVFKIVNRAINKATPGIVQSSVKRVQKSRKSDPAFFGGS